MYGILDKVILLLCCSAFYIVDSKSLYVSLPVIIIVIIIALITYFENTLATILLFLMYFIACFFIPELLLFATLMCYDIFNKKYFFVIFLLIIPYVIYLDNFKGIVLMANFILLVVSFLLMRRTTEITRLRYEYIKLRDNAKELSDNLNIKNKNLLEKNEYEINLATLNERNRIAREIHDTVGHLLSSSILQIGALIAISKDNHVKESLRNVKDTLTKGMDSIRLSIHKLHEDSIDLHSELTKLTKEFVFCQAILEYNITTDLKVQEKYAIIYILKEALANVIKHSDATKVNVVLHEHPGLYQFIISDNGSLKKIEGTKGMGIESIKERVENLGGQININEKDGFKIFISIPKVLQK